MFEHVYVNSIAKTEEGKARYVIRQLYDHYIEYLNELPEEYIKLIEVKGVSRERAVCDFIAGMTDHYAVMKYESLTIPRMWSVL